MNISMVPILFKASVLAGESSQLEQWLRCHQASLTDGETRFIGTEPTVRYLTAWMNALEVNRVESFSYVCDGHTCAIEITRTGKLVRPFAGIFPLGRQVNCHSVWTFQWYGTQQIQIWSDSDLWQSLRNAYRKDPRGQENLAMSPNLYLWPSVGYTEQIDLENVVDTRWAIELKLPAYLARVAAGWVAGCETKQLTQLLNISASTLSTYARTLRSHLGVQSKSEAIAKLIRVAEAGHDCPVP